MSKKIAILFSSGLDSTYLMWKALKDGHEVYPIYIELKNNENKSLIEKQQCQLLINEFNKEFNKEIKLNSSITVDVHNTSNLSFPQPFLWTTLVSSGFDLIYDELQIGYVYGDAVIAYIPEIKKLYNSSKPFIRTQPKLTFPEIKTHKEDIVRELPEKYLKLVVSCENLQLKPYGINNKDFKYRFFEPCGRCEVCRKIIHNYFYGCKITRKNYASAEKVYNKNMFDEFNYKINTKELEVLSNDTSQNNTIKMNKKDEV